MSVDPWVHEFLKGQIDRHLLQWKGREVVVHRYMQSPARGTLLRGDYSRGTLVLAGFGTIPVDQIDRIEAA